MEERLEQITTELAVVKRDVQAFAGALKEEKEKREMWTPKPGLRVEPRRRVRRARLPQDLVALRDLVENELACVDDARDLGDVVAVASGTTLMRSGAAPMFAKVKTSTTHHSRRAYVGPASTSSRWQPARKMGRHSSDVEMSCGLMHALSSQIICR